MLAFVKMTSEGGPASSWLANMDSAIMPTLVPRSWVNIV